VQFLASLKHYNDILNRFMADKGVYLSNSLFIDQVNKYTKAIRYRLSKYIAENPTHFSNDFEAGFVNRYVFGANI
jgi:hypothetical protein